VILQVPQALILNPPGYGGDPNRMIDIGLSGLGQLLLACSDGSTMNSDTGLCADGSIPVAAGASPVAAPCYGADFTGPLPPGSQVCTNSTGQLLNSNGTLASGTPSAPLPTGNSIPASSIAQVIGAAGNAASSAIMASNAPTGYVWNPTTGTYVRAVSTGVPAAGGLSTTVGISGSIMLPIIGLVVVAGLLMVLKK
jgi:hypothetical protein